MKKKNYSKFKTEAYCLKLVFLVTGESENSQYHEVMTNYQWTLDVKHFFSFG